MQITRDLLQRPFVRFLLIALVLFACWRSSYNFFWRDEWNFLDQVRNAGFSWLFEPFNGHIKPLFKLVYFLEIHLFGTNTNLYQYVNLLVYALAIGGAWRLFVREQEPSTKTAFVAVLVLAIHPVNYNHLLWAFQLCQSLFMLFQVASVVYFVRYLQSDRRGDLYLSLLLLICQNYSFGNGLFFPWLFIAVLVLFRWTTHRRLILIYFFIFLITIGIQAVFGLGSSLAGSITGRLPEIFSSFVSFIDLNLARTFTIADVIHNRVPFFILGGFTILVIVGYRRTVVNKAYLTLAVFWLLTNSLSIPIARDIKDAYLPHYYSVMSLIPTIWIVYLVAGDFLQQLAKRYARIALLSGGLIIIAFFLIDSRMNAVFTIRNIRNEAALMQAVREEKPYYAFDDPFFTRDDEYRIPEVKAIYRYWDGRTRIHTNPHNNRD